MNEEQYQIWWQLHRRFAKGESLTEVELQEYEKGRTALEAEEQREQQVPAISAWQERWQELNHRAQYLARQDAALRQQATLLEDQYLALTGEKLCLEA